MRTSLSSAQIDASNRKLFIRLLAKKARDSKKLILTLYACSTGESPRKTQDGNNGFADLCRDDLEAAGFTSGHVDAHTIAAHATQNAYVRRFDIGPGSNIGGDWLISPESPEWPRWRARLHAKAADDAFRFDFPYLSRDEVAAACKEHG